MTAAKHAELKLEDVPYSDPQETIRLGSRLISSKVGIIRVIGPGICRAQDPAIFIYGHYRSGPLSLFIHFECK